MRQLPSGRARHVVVPDVQPVCNRGVGLEHPARRQVEGCDGRRARKLGHVLPQTEFVLPIHRDHERQGGERAKAQQKAGRSAAAPDLERLDLPKQRQDNSRQHEREAGFPDEAGENRQEERGGCDVDDHDIDERHRRHHDAVLELRQRDQADDQRQREERRRQRTAQHDEPEEVEQPPRQHERGLRRGLGLGPEQDAEGREVNRRQQRDARGMPSIGRREAVLQTEDGGRHDSALQPRPATVIGAESRHLSVIKPSWQGPGSRRPQYCRRRPQTDGGMEGPRATGTISRRPPS